MCPMEGRMRFRMAEKEKLLHSMDTSLIRTLNGIVHQRVLRASADQVLSNKDSLDLPNSFVGSVRIFSDRIMTILKSYALVVYPVHVVLLNFVKDYKTWQIQSGHSLVKFLSVETGKSQGMKDAGSGGSREVVYECSTSLILDTEDR